MRSILWIGYYPEPDSHIRDKVKVVLDLSSYATTKELDHATRVDTSDWVTQKYFITLKLDINKLVNVPTSLNKLKTKVDDFDVGKFKTAPVKKLKIKKIKWCSR